MSTLFKSSGGFDANNQSISNIADAVDLQDALNLRGFTEKNTVQVYSSGRTYPIDFVVEYNGQLWKCVTPVTMVGEVFDKSKWKALAGRENWIRITNTYIAVAMDSLLVDTTAGSITITLPANPTNGDYVIIQDSGNADINNITINRNGQTINGSPNNQTITDAGSTVTLLYLNSTWVLNRTRLPRVKISNGALTAQVNTRYAFDSASSYTVTLPATPKIGDWVEIYDRSKTLGANIITVSGNSKQIDGASSIGLDQKGGAWLFTFDGVSWKSQAFYGNSLQADKNLSELTDKAAARNNLLLGSLAVLNTGAAAGEVRTNAQNDLVYQPKDATLTALAALVTATDKLIYSTGSDQFAQTDLPARARTFLAQTTQSGQRGDLGLGDSATKNVGESVGDVLGVGAFGIGSVAPQSTDLNSIVKSGFYTALQTATGSPSATKSVVIHIEHNSVSIGASQAAIDSTGKLYIRTRDNTGVWSGWVQFAATNTLGTAAYKDFGVDSGDLMEVGAFGLGSTPSMISDLNNTSNPTGFYRFDAATANKPSAITAGYVSIIWESVNNFQQIAYSSSNNVILRRVCLGGVFGSWGYIHTNLTIGNAITTTVGTMIGANGDPAKPIGVGGFGVGAIDPTPLANLDDQSTANGLYSIDATTTGTKPVFGHSGITLVNGSLIVGRYGSTASGTKGVTQTIFSSDAKSGWVRRWDNTSGVWGAWVEIQTIENTFPAWTEVTYQNAWTNFGSGYDNVSYRKEGKRVYFAGVGKKDSTGTSIMFTMPVGFRPQAPKMIPIVLGNAVAGILNVAVSGDVTLNAYAAASVAVPFDGISFEID